MKRPSYLRLRKLRLKNFMQDAGIIMEPLGKSFVVSGPTGSGKSTKASAIMWLLFACNIAGDGAGPWIKTTDQNPTSPTFNQPIPKLDHEAEAEFEIGDGDTITLMGRYTEKWETPSGSDKAACTGHTTQWFVDGIPKSQAEYKAIIAAICAPKWLRILADPAYFFGLEPKEQRSLLMEICGDFTDAEVVAKTPALKELPTILGRHSVSDYRRKIDAERKPLAIERGKIPTKIGAIKDGLPPSVPGDHAAEIILRRQRLKGLQDKKAAANKTGNLIDLKNEVRRLEGEMQADEARIRLVGDPAREKALIEQATLRRELSESQFKAKNLDTKIMAHEADIARWDQQLTGLRAEKAQIKVAIESIMAEGFEGELLCSFCGAELSEDKAAEALGKFKADQARRLDKKHRELAANNTEGKSLKERMELAQTEIAGWTVEGESARVNLAGLQARESAIVVPPATVVDHTRHPAWLDWKSKRDAAQLKVTAEEGGESSVIAELDAEIAKVQSLIEDAVRAQGIEERRAADEKRVEDLGAEEKRIAADIERIDREAYLCDQFVIAKCRLLNDRIKSKFKCCDFVLARPNITNDGIQEVCELSFRGAPPSTGQRVLCGIDMHNAVSDYLGFESFVIVDNAESCTLALDTRGQQIRLRATEDVEDLTIRMIDRVNVRDVLFA